MANRSSADAGPSDEYSFRSRASSIISTGTKTSIGTFLTTPFNPQALPQSAPIEQSATASNVIDVLLGRRNFRISARPGSILSISSYDVPAPPYSEAIDTPAVSVESLQALGPALTPQARATIPDSNLDLSRRPSPSQVHVRPSTADTEVTITNTTSQRDEDDDEISTNATSSPPSPPLSPLDVSRNAISAHYTNVVRTIDTNHRAEVARLEANHQAQLAALRTAHEAELDELDNKWGMELDSLRTELGSTHQGSLAATRNEIDAVYRGEFSRMRQENHELQASSDVVKALKDQAVAKAIELDRQISGLEKEVAALQTDKARLEKEAEERETAAKKEAEERERQARNEVEDVWEKRWLDRMKLAQDQVAKAEDVCEKRWLGRMKLAQDQVAKADRQVSIVYEEIESRWPGMGSEVEEKVKQKFNTEETAAKAKKGKKWTFSQA